MVQMIIDLGNFIKTLVASRAGIFVLGLLIGLATLYPAYKVNIYKEQENIQLQKNIDSLTKDRNNWQDRAFNAETTCLAKIKEMAQYFKELEHMYDKTANAQLQSISTRKESLQVYKDLSEKLDKIEQQ